MKKKPNWTQPSAHRTATSSNRRRKAVLLGTVLCIGSGVAYGQQSGNANDATTPQVEETVVVKAKALKDAEKAKARLEKVTGTASVVNNADVERGRAQNAEDVLAYQAGVFAAATSGTGANKISIRGSGLNAFYQGYSLGIKYLIDGLPITGPGGTQEDFLTLNGIDYTEILNGANAFSYTALSLGGAINFVTHTGRSSPGTNVSVEAGSYGYRKYGISTGGVSADGNTDYYLDYVYNERNGFQVNTPTSGNDYIVNIGHKFNDRVETRLVIRHRDEELRNGGTLTLSQLENNPRQNPTQTSARRKPGTTFIGDTTTFTLDGQSKIEAGFAYNDYPLENGWKYATNPQDWRSKDATVSLRYLRTGDTLFGLPSDTTVAFSNTTLLDGDVQGYRQNLSTGVRTPTQYTKYSGSRDTVLALGNELKLSDRATLSSGLSFIEVDRDVRIEKTTLPPSPLPFGRAVSYKDDSIAPRFGFRYQAAPDIQVFGNVSRSIDPPVTWQLGSTGNPYIRPLKPQKANTGEIGLRLTGEVNEGTLTFYRSYVSDELLTTVAVPATSTTQALIANTNASKTIHQGIEAALTSRLWKSGDGDRLIYRQAYTFSDFYYRNDARYGQNELPSLPRHLYQGELLWQQAGGFYSSINVRTMSGYYVDYANTLRAPNATIWGAKFGYEEPGKRWKAYIDFRNIFDKHYAAAANTVDDATKVAGGSAASANFYPGDGFSIYSGVSYRF